MLVKKKFCSKKFAQKLTETGLLKKNFARKKFGSKTTPDRFA